MKWIICFIVVFLSGCLRNTDVPVANIQPINVSSPNILNNPCDSWKTLIEDLLLQCKSIDLENEEHFTLNKSPLFINFESNDKQAMFTKSSFDAGNIKIDFNDTCSLIRDDVDILFVQSPKYRLTCTKDNGDYNLFAFLELFNTTSIGDIKEFICNIYKLDAQTIIKNIKQNGYGALMKLTVNDVIMLKLRIILSTHGNRSFILATDQDSIVVSEQREKRTEKKITDITTIIVYDVVNKKQNLINLYVDRTKSDTFENAINWRDLFKIKIRK